MAMFGIKKVSYSTDDGTIVTARLSELQSRPSSGNRTRPVHLGHQ